MKTSFDYAMLPLIIVAAIIWWPLSMAGATQMTTHGLPIVVMMAPPTYPIVARLAHVEGVVHLRVTTDGRGVISTEQEGRTPQLLVAVAAKNVRSWQFEPGGPTTFDVAYTYKLVSQHISDADSTSVTLKLPTEVEISASVPVNSALAPNKTDH